ncbi:NAD(P)-dependent oxidoreductase [Leucobacter luti]|uniref:3-hydroxyisobutyrate dehydrogenase n=1 Tax=Leucobacter luti TaxID=340320 RepID=A0A4Q7U3Z6_9MICO|nr:NAD(P)-dependent oxidoreductase [Leucobacter luti]MBL3700708.1 NAD(P)-dependent oxidoreductase [Leucobacter luti]RZT68451.1 3-hydroxyisobutyrate dehydrogenase [Leucobacter luti]
MTGTSSPARVGFIGLGAMGAPMAHRLLDAGHELHVWNRSPERAAPFAARGARVADGPAELAESCDIVLGCVLGSAAVREVYLCEGGLVSAARPGLVLVEHGTFDPGLASELGAAAAARGVFFADAPVSGGAVAAAAGTLAVMAGGHPEARQPLLEVAAAYAGVIEWLGPVGSGLALKLVNQMLVSTHVAIAAEAANLIDALGIDPAAATRALSGGWAQSAMLERCLPLALAADFEAPSDATIGGLAEAQRLLAELSATTATPLPVFASAAERFAAARALGWGGRDLAALAALTRR